MAEVVLKIDGVEVSAPRGMFILEAARRAGIAIPNYCAYPDLRPWGECRMCTVDVKTRRGQWTEIACSTPVADGMEVFTNTKKIQDVRRFLLEGMFVHHPLDCPICDKSGECDLQSMGYEYEVPAANPFRQPKAAWEYDYLSSAIAIKRDRCVQCGRCVRVCDELIGAKALAFVKRSEDMYISTPWEGELLGETNCTSCGLCVQVCPVGSLLYTPTKDTIRSWELTRTPSICSHCSVGCGMKLQVERQSGYLRRIVADREDGANDARLCAKGRFGFDFVHHPNRITTPLVKRNGRFEPATWSEALALVAEAFDRNRGDRFGAISSGRLTNEEQYLLQKFTRATLGSNNVDSSARLSDAPAIYGLLDTLGAAGWTRDLYDLKDEAGCALLIGANIADSQPVLWYMLQESMRRRNATLIVVDPRPIPPDEIADEVVRIRPGTDLAFLNGLAHVILRDGLDVEAVSQIDGFGDWHRDIVGLSLDAISRETGVPVAQIERVARLFATGGAGPDRRDADGSYPASAIVAGGGLTQWSHGTDTVRALAHLALLTGNVERPGSGVRFVRSEANSQGAADMGALADRLPGYGRVEDAVARAALEAEWFAGLDRRLPERPGLRYGAMVEAAEQGQLGALWVLNEDVVRALPDGQRVRGALGRLDFLVVTDLFMTETAQMADVVLPAGAWSEKSGTYTNTERRVQALHAAMPPVGDVRAEWDVIADLSTRLGYEMRYLRPADVFEELARTVPSYAGLTLARLAGTELHQTPKPGLLYGDRVPLVLERAGVRWGEPHPPAPSPAWGGGDDRAMVTTAQAPGRWRFGGVKTAAEAAAAGDRAELTLVVGGTLYQAGLGTETERSETLISLDYGAFVGLAVADAARLGIVEGTRVRVSSAAGRIEAPARLVPHQPEGIVWVPPHYAEAPVRSLFGWTFDPESGAPAVRSCAVRVEALGEPAGVGGATEARGGVTG